MSLILAEAVVSHGVTLRNLMIGPRFAQGIYKWDDWCLPWFCLKLGDVNITRDIQWLIWSHSCQHSPLKVSPICRHGIAASFRGGSENEEDTGRRNVVAVARYRHAIDRQYANAIKINTVVQSTVHAIYIYIYHHISRYMICVY